MKGLQKYLDKVVQGDCLKVLPLLPDRCIDMVLCDLPYNTTRNPWDIEIDLPSLWQQYMRIIKPNGILALTAQGLFTAKLIISNAAMFKYKIAWIKSQATNFLNAKKQPLRRHEDICIFYRGKSCYQPQMSNGKPYDTTRKHGHNGSYNGFTGLLTNNVSGKRYPNDIIFYEDEADVGLQDAVMIKNACSEGKGSVVHTTQKPVELGRYLIRNYLNEGDIILDNVCGSGSLLVAAIKENRHFIDIEKNQHCIKGGRETVDFIATANSRIQKAMLENSNNIIHNKNEDVWKTRHNHPSS